MSLERCNDCGQPWTQHTTGGCPARTVTEFREPERLDAAALEAAERAYWKDDGVSRHNLAAAIQAYLGARPPEEPPPLNGGSPRLQELLKRCPFLLADAAPDRIGEWYFRAAVWLMHEGVTLGGAAPLRGPSPRLPDTFVERAVRMAQTMVEPNEDVGVTLTAFEASAIRRGAGSPQPPREETK